MSRTSDPKREDSLLRALSHPPRRTWTDLVVHHGARLLVLLVVAAVLTALGIAATTAVGRLFMAFLVESRVEVRKVIWPSRQETTQSTLVVVALVFVVGILLWTLDAVLFWGISLMTGQGN